MHRPSEPVLHMADGTSIESELKTETIQEAVQWAEENSVIDDIKITDCVTLFNKNNVPTDLLKRLNEEIVRYIYLSHSDHTTNTDKRGRWEIGLVGMFTTINGDDKINVNLVALQSKDTCKFEGEKVVAGCIYTIPKGTSKDIRPKGLFLLTGEMRHSRC